MRDVGDLGALARLLAVRGDGEADGLDVLRAELTPHGSQTTDPPSAAGDVAARYGRVGVLTIHRAERADRLVDALASILVTPLDDPFTPEIVSVPTRGVERWVTQRLSSVLGSSPGRRDGVCAN